MKRSLGLLAIMAMFAALAACGGSQEQPPLTPDSPEADADAGTISTLPAPDPHNK